MSTSERFLPLNATTLLRYNGVFSEHQLYHNSENEIFARKGNGYLRLMAHNATSVNRLYWSDLDLDPHAWDIKGGRLVYIFPIREAA